jgi:hypothetical protein
VNDDDDLFATGTATLIGTKGKFAVVKCPHCHGRHAHEQASVGSQAVLAVCSTPSRPRIYEIASRPRKAKR